MFTYSVSKGTCFDTEGETKTINKSILGNRNTGGVRMVPCGYSAQKKKKKKKKKKKLT